MGKRTFYERAKRIEKLTNEEKLDLVFDLINSFRIVRKPLETALFLQNLLTANEIKNLSVRLRIAKLLLSGKTQREIADELHCSFATITKVSLWLGSGGEGLKNVISKLPVKYDFPRPLPKVPVEFHLPQLILTVTQYLLAKNQRKAPQKLLEEIASKEILDKSLQEEFDRYYMTQKSKKRKPIFDV